eukprot:6491772-Prymnesium_polylepis.4
MARHAGSKGLCDDGEIKGTLPRDATCAAETEAVEQPAPIMALMEEASSSLVRLKAPAKPSELSHLLSK